MEPGNLRRTPSLVERGDLLAANAAFEGARAGGQTVGPAMAGFLVRAFAIVADAVSFVASAALLATVRVPDRSPTASLVRCTGSSRRQCGRRRSRRARRPA